MHQLGYLLHRATKLLDQEFHTQLRDLGLTPRQASVLMALSAHEPSTPTRLSEGLGIDRATMSGLVSRLSRDGWTAVRSNPADGRSQSLTLTSNARDALPRIRSASERAEARVLSGMEPGAVEALLGALSTLVADDRVEREGLGS